MTRANHILEPEDLMAYLDGELRPDRAAEAASHLANCKECQALAAELQEVSRTLLKWEVETAGSETQDDAASVWDQHSVETGSERHAHGVRRGLVTYLRASRVRLAVGGLASAVVVSVILFSFYKAPESAHLKQSKEGEAISTYLMKAPQNAPSAKASEGMASRADAFRSGTGSGTDLSGLARIEDGVVGNVNGLPGRGFANMESGSGSAGKLELRKSEPSAAAAAGPMIIRTANLTLISNHFESVRSGLDEIVNRHGGYIAQLTAQSPPDNGRSINGTIRIPATQLDATLEELKTLGRTETETQSGQEVTAEYVDLQARLTNSYNTEKRLTDILRNRTGRLSDVLEVEQEIDRVRGEIEEMEAQKKTLKDQVDLASVSFSVREDTKAQLKVLPFSTGMRFRYALIAGYRTMMDSLIEVLLWLLSWLPTLLIWGAVLFFPLRFAWRKLRPRTAP